MLILTVIVVRWLHVRQHLNLVVLCSWFDDLSLISCVQTVDHFVSSVWRPVNHLASPQFDGLPITSLLLSLTACQSLCMCSVWQPVNQLACLQFDGLSITLRVLSLTACQSPCVSSVWQPVDQLACPQFDSLPITLLLSLTACQSLCVCSVWQPVNQLACPQFDSLSITLRILSLMTCQSPCVSSVWWPVNRLACPQFDGLSITLRVLSLMACQSPCVSSVWRPEDRDALVRRFHRPHPAAQAGEPPKRSLRSEAGSAVQEAGGDRRHDGGRVRRESGRRRSEHPNHVGATQAGVPGGDAEQLQTRPRLQRLCESYSPLRAHTGPTGPYRLYVSMMRSENVLVELMALEQCVMHKVF